MSLRIPRLPPDDRSGATSRATPTAARALLLLCSAVALACGSDVPISTTEPEAGPGTVYALASANDVSLPAVFTKGGETVEVRKGALTLGTDSTFIFSLALRTSRNGAQASSGTTTLRGQLKRTGTALALLQQGDTLFAGTYTPNAVNLVVGKAQVTGERFVFVR